MSESISESIKSIKHDDGSVEVFENGELVSYTPAPGQCYGCAGCPDFEVCTWKGGA